MASFIGLESPNASDSGCWDSYRAVCLSVTTVQSHDKDMFWEDVRATQTQPLSLTSHVWPDKIPTWPWPVRSQGPQPIPQEQ